MAITVRYSPIAAAMELAQQAGLGQGSLQRAQMQQAQAQLMLEQNARRRAAELRDRELSLQSALQFARLNQESNRHAQNAALQAEKIRASQIAGNRAADQRMALERMKLDEDRRMEREFVDRFGTTPEVAREQRLVEAEARRQRQAQQNAQMRQNQDALRALNARIKSLREKGTIGDIFLENRLSPQELAELGQAEQTVKALTDSLLGNSSSAIGQPAPMQGFENNAQAEMQQVKANTFQQAVQALRQQQPPDNQALQVLMQVPGITREEVIMGLKQAGYAITD